MGDSVIERLASLETEVGTLKRDLEEKHRENRRSIHDLRNGQQNVLDALHRLDLKLARAVGYAMGAGAAIALIAHMIDRFPR